MWPLAVLTGDRINVFFFYKEMYDRSPGRKKLAVITIVTVLFLSRWP